jgi:hypothetical protein
VIRGWIIIPTPTKNTRRRNQPVNDGGVACPRLYVDMEALAFVRETRPVHSAL